MEFKTYHKKKRPQTFNAFIDREGERITQGIPVSDYPSPIILPIFPKPAFLDNKPFSGNQIIRYAYLQVGGKAGEQLRIEQNADQLTVEVKLWPFSFAQMIAKIAYCMAISEFGMDAFEQVHVLPVILGVSEEVCRWVGTDDLSTLKPDRELHTLEMLIRDREVTCRVRLFAAMNGPHYLVSVGRLKTDLSLF